MKKGTREIPLSRGQVAVVDEEDYAWLSQWKWYARKHGKTFYAERNSPFFNHKSLLPSTMVKMHRQLIGAKREEEVDHRDRNGLNNTKANLRISNRTGNNCNQELRSDNTSGFKGVSWHKPTRKWKAQIQINKQKTFLGHFTNIEDAARAYDVAATRGHREFARLNFPLDNQSQKE